MPKHEAGTPKAIANKIKAKGLQKLRWYCQMCQKQCRDENGFKCHTMSESHQRQLLLFAENPDKYIDSFSKEFEDGFLELLKRRFGTKRVHANQVYQEYIADRHHLHMNATMWETLTDFVKWLGREGKCKVDQTEKGWFITYIDRDPDTIQRQEAMAKKEKMDKDDEEKMMEFINKQIVRAKEQEKEDASPVFTELQRTNEDEKVVISIGKSTKDTKQVKPSALVKSALTEAEEKLKLNKTTKNELSGKRKKTTLDEIMEEQEKMKERANRKDYWITEDIVVKVIAKSLGDKYYKKKGVIKEVRDRYQAVVKMIDSNDILKLDQAHLQTVIPAIGRRIKVVNGAYRDSKAILKSIDEDHFCCTIQIDTGLLKGRVVKGVQYEDVCKLHSS